jgi:hypothetical protein
MLYQIAALARLDLAPQHRQPPWTRIAAAAVLAVAGSLVADIFLVAIGETVWPATRHFQHFQLSDYGKLTVVGVIIACVAWPVVTRISSVPDVYILHLGEPARGVAVLMLMHLAIAVVTYNLLVRLAPVRPGQVGEASVTVARSA